MTLKDPARINLRVPEDLVPFVDWLTKEHRKRLARATRQDAILQVLTDLQSKMGWTPELETQAGRKAKR